ncbi:MAG: hypothetical protein JST93_19675 [Acidobacteria bacterium]|nr:hypothetical protein [Acidobacteriota bacterium]
MLFAPILLFSAEAFAQFRLVSGGQTVTQIAFNDPDGPLLSQSFNLSWATGPVDFWGTPFTRSGNWLEVTSSGTTGPSGNSVEVRVRPNLPPGVYSGNVVFQRPGNPATALTIPVILNMTRYALTIDPPAVYRYYSNGSANPTASVNFSSNYGLPLSYTAQLTAGADFVSITSGSAGSGVFHTIHLTFSGIGLPPADTLYTAYLQITIAGQRDPVEIPVSLAIYSGYTVTPTSITLSGGQTSRSVTLTPSSLTPPSSYLTSAVTAIGASWLSVTPPASIAPVPGPQTFSITANPSGLTAGFTYMGSVRVQTGNQIQDIAVAFAPVASPGSSITGYSVVPTAVHLDGGNLSQVVTLSQTTATGPYFYVTAVSTDSGGSWLSTNPSSSANAVSGTQSFVIYANPSGLSLGTYTGIVRIFIGTQLQTIPVTLTVPDPTPRITTTLPGGIAGSPYSQVLQAANGRPPYTWSHTGLPDGLALDPNSGSLFGFTPKAGTYRAAITVRDSAQSSSTTTFPIVIQRPQPHIHKQSFVPLPPCRIMETRPEYNFEGRSGPLGPPFLTANETRTLTLSSSTVCPIPSTASALILNVTAIPRGPLDFVTIFPGDESRPDFRTVSSPDGQIVANTAVVPVGSGGTLKVFASANTDLIIDVTGYMVRILDTQGVAYYPVTPCRAIETRAEYRNPAGPFGPPTLNTGETRRFRIPESPHCSLPASPSAYSATVTVVPQGPLPYLTAWPSGVSQPNVSSINSFQGRVVANHVIIPAGANGAIDVFAFDRTDIIVDITGYFALDDGVKGLYYYPLVQCRLANTESIAFTDTFGPPQLGTGATRLLPLLHSTKCPAIPATAKAYALNVTALPGGSPMPFLTLFPTGQPRPNASILNAFEGQTITNSAIVAAGTNGYVDLFSYRPTHVIVEISGYFAR